MSQRGYDLLDLYVKWEIEEQHERWSMDVLADKTFEYISLCCKQDYHVLQLYDECEMAVEKKLDSAKAPREVLDAVLVKVLANPLVLENAAYNALSKEKQIAICDCLLLKLAAEEKIEVILALDWLEMTGEDLDVVEIPSRWQDLYLVDAPMNTPHAPEDFKRFLKKIDFLRWRLKSAVLLADAYSEVTEIVAEKVLKDNAMDELKLRIDNGELNELDA
jgi:BarA-like signal transduction histidine kinase